MKEHLLKRITPIIALAVMLCIVAVCFISGTAATEYNSGDWKYTVSNGKATVIGYTGTETTLNFPTTLGGYPVDSIGYSAIKNNARVNSVIIPEGYGSIGESAFYGCKRLQNVIIKENTNKDFERTIGNYAFEGCIALNEICIPEGYVSIGGYAFRGCEYLNNVSIPKSIKDIGTYLYGYSFGECIRLETVTLVEGGTSAATIQDTTFKGCTALKSITIPANYNSIGMAAFSGCTNLQNVTIKGNDNQQSGRIIYEYAFEKCTALTEIFIPEGFTSIGYCAFKECSNLKSANIPKSIQDMGWSCFENCISLESLILTEGGTETIPSSAFMGCKALKSITIPKSCKNISSDAFRECTSLQTVIISENIDPYFERTIGANSFLNCTSLTEIKIPEGFIAIGSSVFNGCSNLKDVAIPNSIQSIGSSSFKNCINLKTINFGENGKATIPSSAFSGCSDLKSIIVPANYKDVEYGAFEGCTNLQTVIIKDSDDPYLKRIIDGNSFKGCTALTMVHIPANIESIDDTAFNNRSEDLVICSTTYDCTAKTYADANGISFVLCNGEHELPIIPDTPVVTTYTLSYDANGGSGAPAVQSGATTYTISTTVPVRSGYKFLGWAFDKNETSASCVGGANITVSADTVLYAVWEKIPDEPTTEPTEPATQPSTVPATQPTTRPTEPTTKPAQPTTKPTEPVTEPSTMKPAVIVKIKTPSQSTINYGDSIILHADTENLPEGAYIKWTVSSGNFKIVSRSVDSKNCTITPEATGADVITATVYDADGNEISSDTQTMTAKAGFFQKIIAFFKKLFGLTKVIPEAFKF